MTSALSPKQEEFILQSTAKINIAHGSVRSGKTYASLIRWAEFVVSCPDDNLAMIGKSLDSIYTNAVKPLKDELFKGFCSYVTGARGAVLTFGGKTIRIIGANDQGAVGRIQGNTLSGAYCDEMTILPENFMEMLYSRLSPVHAKLFGTTNPDGPSHPIKKLIDKADGKNIYALHFELKDNPALDQSYKDLIEKLYSGLWYRRYVLGEWCMAEGAIYDFFDRKFHVVSRAPTFGRIYIAGVDYGTSNPFCALLIGINGDTHPSIWVEKEYYWDPKHTGRQRTDSEHADAVEELLFGYPVKLIYTDPSAQSLEVEMKKRRKPIKQAENDVLNGIRVVGDFLGQGDLVICQSCPNLVRELEGYTWDPKKGETGQDAPKKSNDHACDALRYALYTHFGNTKTLPKTPELKKKNLMDTRGFGDGHGWQTYGGGSQLPGGRR